MHILIKIDAVNNKMFMVIIRDEPWNKLKAEDIVNNKNALI